MNYHLIINPAAAGGKTAGRAEEIARAVEKVLGAGGATITTHAGHATEVAREQLSRGDVDTIIAAGGDGTIHEVVNGFFDASGSPIVERPRLGILPAGSGGDFKRSFGLTDSLDEALARMAGNSPTPIDLGRLTAQGREPEIFANISSVGLSAEIGVNTNRSRRLKRINANLAFNYNIVASALRHKPYPLRIRSSEDPEGQVWQANCVAVCNGQYFGSGVRIARDADTSSGQLEIVVVHDHSAIGFLKGVDQLKRVGSLPEGMTSYSASWVEICCEEEPERQVLIEADGEYAGELTARFEVLPGVVDLL